MISFTMCHASNFSSNDLGKEFYNRITSTEYDIKIIDFENIDNNDFAVVDELPFSIKEDTEEYGEYRIGDIVFVNKYRYSNGKIGHKHLFVIIEKDNYAVPLEYFSMIHILLIHYQILIFPVFHNHYSFSITLFC